MFIIVGLGNPERKYDGTRHNIGFSAITVIADKYNISMDIKKHKAVCGKGYIEGQKVILAMPQTYMNLSGECVEELLQWYKVPLDHLLIIYDDIDLPLAKLRVRKTGSAGTHNGMRSIMAHVPSQEFPRIRVGVGAKPEGWELADWVLSRYAIREEQEAMASAFQSAADCVEDWLGHGIDDAMQRFNHK